MALSRPKHGFDSRWEHHPIPAEAALPSPFALAFIDCEFGGLDPEQHDITEIAAIVTDDRLAEIVSAEWKVRARPERITAEAAAIHGFDPILWKDAVPLRQALSELSALLPRGRTVLPAGQNVRMDVQFLERGYRRCGLAYPFDYHVIDLATLYYAWSLVAGETPSTLSLRQAATTAGLVDGPVPHRALEDARLALEAFRHFVGRLAPREPSDLRAPPAPPRTR
ncbi:MAG TPA: 3'-5' exonuclease [Myxococcota bacterium]|nr:3'-5' exonuclease [Myxococcota bacterium]